MDCIVCPKVLHSEWPSGIPDDICYLSKSQVNWFTFSLPNNGSIVFLATSTSIAILSNDKNRAHLLPVARKIVIKVGYRCKVG